MSKVHNWHLNRDMEYPYEGSRPSRQIAYIFDTNKCIACQTCTVASGNGTASADVCASAGRRISVSGCANLGDVMAPYVPPPGYYAPMPEDFNNPGVSGCVGWNGRWVSANTCS